MATDRLVGRCVQSLRSLNAESRGRFPRGGRAKKITWRDIRKLALGRLGWTPQTFYSSTLRDLFDAVEGLNEFENEKAELMFFAARRITWAVFAQWDKNLREDKMWPLSLDEQIRKESIKGLEPMKVEIDGIVQ